MLRKVTVRDYMYTKVTPIKPSMSIRDAVRRMLENRITAVIVTDEQGQPVGSLSESECLRVAYNAAYHEDYGGTVGDYMTKDVPSVHPDMSILDLTEKFMKEPYRNYPVVENGMMVGVISRVDIMRALVAMA